MEEWKTIGWICCGPSWAADQVFDPTVWAVECRRNGMNMSISTMVLFCSFQESLSHILSHPYQSLRMWSLMWQWETESLCWDPMELGNPPSWTFSTVHWSLKKWDWKVAMKSRAKSTVITTWRLVTLFSIISILWRMDWLLFSTWWRLLLEQQNRNWEDYWDRLESVVLWLFKFGFWGRVISSPLVRYREVRNRESCLQRSRTFNLTSCCWMSLPIIWIWTLSKLWSRRWRLSMVVWWL